MKECRKYTMGFTKEIFDADPGSWEELVSRSEIVTRVRPMANKIAWRVLSHLEAGNKSFRNLGAVVSSRIIDSCWR